MPKENFRPVPLKGLKIQVINAKYGRTAASQLKKTGTQKPCTITKLRLPYYFKLHGTLLTLLLSRFVGKNRLKYDVLKYSYIYVPPAPFVNSKYYRSELSVYRI